MFSFVFEKNVFLLIKNLPFKRQNLSAYVLGLLWIYLD